MKTSLLDYSKIILERVSFDSNLFQKELKKAQMRLSSSEQHELKSWAENINSQIH